VQLKVTIDWVVNSHDEQATRRLANTIIEDGWARHSRGTTPAQKGTFFAAHGVVWTAWQRLPAAAANRRILE
jgi:hypothetical protein